MKGTPYFAAVAITVPSIERNGSQTCRSEGFSSKATPLVKEEGSLKII